MWKCELHAMWHLCKFPSGSEGSEVIKTCFHRDETFLVSKWACRASPAVRSQLKAAAGSKYTSTQGDIPQLWVMSKACWVGSFPGALYYTQICLLSNNVLLNDSAGPQVDDLWPFISVKVKVIWAFCRICPTCFLLYCKGNTIKHLFNSRPYTVCPIVWI